MRLKPHCALGLAVATLSALVIPTLAVAGNCFPNRPCGSVINVFNPATPNVCTCILDSSGQMATVCQIGDNGSSDGTYAEYWCLCNEPKNGTECEFTSTTSSDSSDDGKKHEDFGCFWTDLPPGVAPTETDCYMGNQTGGCHR